MHQAVRLLVLASFIFSLNITPVLAQDTDSQVDRVIDRLEQLREKREERREQLEEKRQELRQKRQDIREKVQERLDAVKQKVVERIKNVFAKILRRYNAALARLDKIAERIASRIDKLKERGVDTSQAEAELVEAESLGAAAALAIDDAAGQIEAIDPTSTSVRDAIHAARDALQSAKIAIKAYHKGLVEAIRLLKASASLREATDAAE